MNLLESQPIKDHRGGEEPNFVDIGSYWAKINPLKANQRHLYEKANHEISHKIIFRHAVLVKFGMKIEARNRIFEIVSKLSVDEKDRYVEILAKEVST